MPPWCFKAWERHIGSTGVKSGYNVKRVFRVRLVKINWNGFDLVSVSGNGYWRIRLAQI